MAKTVGEAKVLVEGDLNKLNQAFKKGERTTSSFTKKLGGMFRSLFVIDIANLALKFLATVRNMFSKAVGIVKKFTIGIIEASSSYEQLQLTLKVLLKDQEKANMAFDEARELAEKTSFSIEEVVGGYAKLLAYGFKLKEVPDLLLLAADAATAFGKNIDEVVRGMSYLKAGRIEESMLSMGITREALTTKGIEFDQGGALKSSTEEFFKAAMDIWRDSVAGMSIEGQKTWKGMISNLGDAWVDFQATIGDAGIFDAIKGRVKSILDLIGQWAESGQLLEWAQKISDKMTEIFNGVTAVIEKITGIDLSTEMGGTTTEKPDFVKWLKENGEEVRRELDITKSDYKKLITMIDLLGKTALGDLYTEVYRAGEEFNRLYDTWGNAIDMWKNIETPDLRMEYLTDESKLKEMKEKLKLSDADIANIKLAYSTASGELSEAFTNKFLGSEAGLELYAKAKEVSNYITKGILSKSEETKTALTPFWEKVVSGIENETILGRLTSAFINILKGVMENEDLMNQAKETGKEIGNSIAEGIGEALSNWWKNRKDKIGEEGGLAETTGFWMMMNRTWPDGSNK